MLKDPPPLEILQARVRAPTALRTALRGWDCAMPKPDPSSSSLLEAGFELVKQYGGEGQVKLKVVVKIPGSWFGGGAEGSLSAGERRGLQNMQIFVR